jgi:hypothetical protein
MIPKEVMTMFIEMHKADSSDAKFKIGQKVIYKNNIHTILAVNVQELGSIEYAISDHEFLVWEEELNEF